MTFRDSHATIALGRILFPLFALVLDLPDTWFDNKVGSFFSGYILG
jgi:hypothetical protein